MTEDEKAKLILTDQWCWECDCELGEGDCVHDEPLEVLINRLTVLQDNAAIFTMNPEVYRKANEEAAKAEERQKEMNKNRSFVSHKDRYKSPRLRGIK